MKLTLLKNHLQRFIDLLIRQLLETWALKVTAVSVAEMWVTLNDKDCWIKGKVVEPPGHYRPRQWEKFSAINHKNHCTSKRIEKWLSSCIFVFIHAVSTSVHYVTAHHPRPTAYPNQLFYFVLFTFLELNSRLFLSQCYVRLISL